VRHHPVVSGILEHYERAYLFASEGAAAPGPRASFRHLMAAVYSLRGAVELMREAADRGELRVGRRQLEQVVDSLMPRARLVRRLRIRDFHHYGVVGPGHMILEFRIRLAAYGHGSVTFRVNPWNPRLRLGISDRSRNYAFFMTSGILVQDEREPAPITLDHLVAEQLQQLPGALSAFVGLLRS
jgi:hypothetical protein